MASPDEEANLYEAQVRLNDASARVAELESDRALLHERVSDARQRARELSASATDAEKDAEGVAAGLSAERKRAAIAVRSSEEDQRQGLHEWRLQRSWALAGAVFLLFVVLGSTLWPRIVVWPGLRWVRRRPGWLRAAAVGLVALVGLALIGAPGTGASLLGGVLVGSSAAGLLFAFAVPPREIATQEFQNKDPEALQRGRIGLGVTAAVGAIALLMAAIALEKPSAQVPSERVLALAEADDPLRDPTPELRDLLDVAERKMAIASAASARVAEAMRNVRRLNRRLGSVRFAVNRSQQRVDRWEAAVAKPDPVPEPEFVPESTSPSTTTASCDPNYSGCVPPYPPDVDCADVGGSVSVYGSDPHGLDADGDDVGCE